MTPDELRTALALHYGEGTDYHLAKQAARPVEEGGLGVTYDAAMKWFSGSTKKPSVPIGTALFLMRKQGGGQAATGS